MKWKTDISKDNQLPEINWAALQDYAVNLKNSKCEKPTTQTCYIPPIYNKGGLHLAIILEFNDGTKWVARIQLNELTSELEKRLLHEVHTMKIIREQTEVPVPEVFGYETNPDLIGRAFMLIEFIPGSTAMDVTGSHDEIPHKYKAKFCRDMARIQLCCSSTVITSSN